MPAGGDEAAEYETEPFYEGDFSLYTGFRHPRGGGGKRRDGSGRRLRRDPADCGHPRNDPPFFTSNHAAVLQRHGD